jgi:glycosyltransferase involved in cell wall biosynthesis
LSLSIVITCRDDARVVDAVRSVDASAEILIVLNGSPAGFEPRLRRLLGERARIESLPRPNRARSVEHGIAAAARDWILLMDADCVFAPGSVAAVQRAFERGAPGEEVYKGRLVYERGATRASAIVSRSRSQRNRRLSAYKPGLAFSRELAGRLGGYFFDPRLVWKSDAELDERIRRAGLRIVPVEGCAIHHAPLTLRSDLYSSFHYGVGSAIARHLALALPDPERSAAEAWRRDGAEAALYLLVSNGVRTLGRAYAGTRLRLSGERWLAKLSGAQRDTIRRRANP